MDKQEILSRLMKIKKLRRELEDLAEELQIGDISEDKIYIALTSYYSILSQIYNSKENDGK